MQGSWFPASRIIGYWLLVAKCPLDKGISTEAKSYFMRVIVVKSVVLTQIDELNFDFSVCFFLSGRQVL